MPRSHQGLHQELPEPLVGARDNDVSVNEHYKISAFYRRLHILLHYIIITVQKAGGNTIT